MKLTGVIAALGLAASSAAQMQNHIDYVVSPDELDYCRAAGSTFTDLCRRSRTAYVQATADAIRRFGSVDLINNGWADAYRACAWGFLLGKQQTIQYQNNRSDMGRILTKHIETSNRSDFEKRMDLNNVRSGLSYGGSFHYSANNMDELQELVCIQWGKSSLIWQGK